MTASDFDRAFGGASPARSTFAERLGRAGLEANGAPAEGVRDQREYRAYGFLPSGGISESCEVTRFIDTTTIPEGTDFDYRLLMRRGFVADEEIRLFLPDCIILIEGRNLREMRKAIRRRQAHFIQQYSPLVWPKAPSIAETVVERITIAVPERG